MLSGVQVVSLSLSMAALLLAYVLVARGHHLMAEDFLDPVHLHG